MDDSKAAQTVIELEHACRRERSGQQLDHRQRASAGYLPPSGPPRGDYIATALISACIAVYVSALELIRHAPLLAKSITSYRAGYSGRKYCYDRQIKFTAATEPSFKWTYSDNYYDTHDRDLDFRRRHLEIMVPDPCNGVASIFPSMRCIRTEQNMIPNSHRQATSKCH